MRDVGLGDKVYSPDLSNFELSGPTGVFGTIASIVTGPVRLVTRVLHNIPILPADLLKEYYQSLFITSTTLACVGLVDLVFYNKWLLFVVQIPLIGISLTQPKKINKILKAASVKHEVEFDSQRVADMCEKVYDDIEKELEKVG